MSKRYLTVTALTQYIKHKLDKDPHLQDVHVKGEISNFYLHRMSGHMYLTIKDENTQIKAVMFRDDAQHLKFEPESGMSVFVSGYVSLYIQNGQYQLYLKDMQPSGIGALHLAFEQLKEKLQKANYFASEHKRPIPRFPRKIALVTSRDSAALRDMLTTIDKRYPIVQLIVFPVNVQGEQSVNSIVNAIHRANELDFDTLIVARGGGSIEDLASYNDERVAMAIFHSNIPVITGIGHETDTTISDFVADLRAPTPTGAAQFAVPSLEETERRIIYLHNELKRLSKLSFMLKAERLKALEQSRAFTYPLQLVRERGQRIDQLADQLVARAKNQLYIKERAQTKLLQSLAKHHPAERLRLSKQNISLLETQVNNMLQSSLKQKQHALALAIEKLTLLNPLEIMQRGYSITYNLANEMVKSAKDLQIEDAIIVKLHDGEASCEVKEVRTNVEE
ncbi:MAG TPA: exodeoxyribonuclease VII large subunit [Pseudogracilibacillus sp.]|nr:exodeoxyribonuclease VII large subunit [Pseudogracilibacillus sp.]